MRPEERRAAERAARKAAELRAAAVERSRVEQRARAAEEARRSAAVVKARAQTSAEEAERARLERARERARARRADEERARRRQDDLRSQLRALNRERAADEERARSTRAAARARLIAAERDRVVEERQGAERRICEPSPSLEAERAESSRRAAAAERRQAQREAERAESSRRAAAAGRRQAQREAERAESNRRGAAVGRRRAERDAARVESSRQASDADRRQAQREAERRAETLASIRATVRADRAESARAATRAEEQRAQLRDARLDEAKKAQEAVQRQERARARQKKQAGPAPKPPPPPKPKAQPRARTGVLSAYLPWLTVSKGLVVNDRQRKVFLRGVTIRGLEQPRRNPTARPPLTEADVGELGAWGANAIVVPLAQDLILFGQGDVAGDDYLAAVDLTVQTAAEAGMYTILQLEKLAASVPQPYVPDSAHLQSPFPDPGSKGFWGTVARRYATEPAVLFDVFAAPHDPLPSDPTRVIADAITWSFWTSWLLALVGEIRLVHPRSLVIVRGLRRGTDLSGLPLRYTNRKQVPNIVHAASVRGSAYVPMLQRIAALRKSGAAAVVSPWTAEVPGSATLEVLGQRLARSNLHWIVGGWRVGDSPLVEEVQGRLRPTALGRAYRRAFAAPRGPAANLVQPVSERPADVIAEYLNEAHAAEASVSPAGPLTAGERALVRTALPLADRPEDVAALVFLSRAGRRPGRRLALSTKVATGLRDVDDDELAKKDAGVVESLLANMAGELADYERLLAAEWRQVLGLGVQDVWRSFLPLYDPERRNALALKPPERQQPVAFVRYRSLRPAYCRLGYSRPFEQIFSPLVRGSFFGRPVLVQPRVNAMLAQLPAELEARVMPWLAPGHPGGFVPRFIAGTTTLSDHAFGLALDFNPATNPHIKGGLIPVVRWGTRGAPDAPDGYEFGSPLVDENAVPDRATRVAQIHATGRRASDRFARWLRETIAKDDDLALLEKGELALIEGWKRMLVQPAHIAFRDLAEAGLVPAQARLAQIQAAIALSGDLQQLRALRGIARPAEIATWRDTGIRDMPLELPASMTAVGFVWGDEWRGHKDGMHFDLGPVEKVLVPDAPRRRLEDLLAV
jgi:hypothetical protein